MLKILKTPCLFSYFLRWQSCNAAESLLVNSSSLLLANGKKLSAILEVTEQML